VDIVASKLHKNLLKEIDAETEMKSAWEKTYHKTDVQLSKKDVRYAGCTAVTAFLKKTSGERWLHVANVGDARAVLCRGGKAVRLTYEHKGSDRQEAKRVTDAGGFVVLNRVNGILAVTRSLGDHAMKDYVISTPHIEETKLEREDTYLILSCDGLWDVCTDQEATDLIRDESNVDTMANKLLIHALKNGTTDNITVLVIQL